MSDTSGSCRIFRFKYVLVSVLCLGLLYPLSSGPVIKSDIWLSENGYTPQGYAPTLSLYRPLFRFAKDTPLEKPLWGYLEWWVGSFTWDP